jgi:hypothetical protein
MGTPDGTPTATQPTSTEGTPPKGNPSNEVDWEKRFKDTRAELIRTTQTLQTTEAEKAELAKMVVPTPEIDAATQEELDALKLDDPDKWRKRLNKIEREASEKHAARLQAVATEAKTSAEIARRADVLTEFNEGRAIKLTNEMLEFDIPLRITRKLEKGEVTFEEFLAEAGTFLDKPKTVGTGNTVPNQPNMDEMGGGETPAASATERDIIESYRTEVY